MPKIESPFFARSWVEQNLNPSGLGVNWVEGLNDVLCSDRDPLRPVVFDWHSYAALLKQVETGEVLLVHGLGSEPVLPVVRPGIEAGTWQIDTSLSLHAYDNVAQALSHALWTRGNLHPLPTQKSEPLAQKEKAPVKLGTRVTLLPVRYAVGRLQQGEGAYAYNHANLKKDFPKLQQARYVLRTLRAGFVYVWFQNELDCFSISDIGRMRRHGKGGADIRADQDTLTFPEDAGEVMLAFSEHEWTEKQRQKITGNENGCRNSQMQRVDFASPSQDVFPLTELGMQVEEYAGRNGKYAWRTEHPSRGEYEAAARLSTLKSLADKGQYGVALHDPISTTHELTNLIERELDR